MDSVGLFILAQIFGFIGLVLTVISLQKPTYKSLVRLQVAANTLCALQYLCLWSLTALFTSGITAVRNAIFAHYKGRRPPLIWLLLIMAALIAAGIWAYAGPISLLPIAAGLIYSVAMWRGNLKQIRWSAIIACILYIIYKWTVGAYTGILVSLAEMGGAIFALINNRRKLNAPAQKRQVNS